MESTPPAAQVGGGDKPAHRPGVWPAFLYFRQWPGVGRRGAKMEALDKLTSAVDKGDGRWSQASLGVGVQSQEEVFAGLIGWGPVQKVHVWMRSRVQRCLAILRLEWLWKQPPGSESEVPTPTKECEQSSAWASPQQLIGLSLTPPLL